MDNYKITNTEEAISLLDELGYDVTGLNDRSSFLYAKAQDKNVFNGVVHPEDYESISVEKLRDLVVLKRNDINDANWETEGGDQIFKDSNDKSYIYRSDGWDELQRHEMRQAMWEKPIAIAKPQDPALISGADALRALADGKEVELLDEELDIPWTKILTEKDERNAIEPCISMFFDGYREIKFRLKPQTFKLELELPKPFEPKEGEVYYYIQLANDAGIDCKHYCDDKYDRNHLRMGVWRTESEAKQALEMLEELRGAS